MSERGVRTAETILNKLLKAKGQSREVLRNIDQAERGLDRVTSIASTLARGDPTALLGYLATMGPVGVKLAVALGVATIGYGIYQKLTEEKPTELYYWRYPE
jgi:hypothetical protein